MNRKTAENSIIKRCCFKKGTPFGNRRNLKYNRQKISTKQTGWKSGSRFVLESKKDYLGITLKIQVQKQANFYKTGFESLIKCGLENPRSYNLKKGGETSNRLFIKYLSFYLLLIIYLQKGVENERKKLLIFILTVFCMFLVPIKGIAVDFIIGCDNLFMIR